MGKIIQANELQEQIFHLHKFGQNAGLKIGFPTLDKLYSIKEGRSTIIYGHPTSGKSQFLIQALCALATRHNKKCLIYPNQDFHLDWMALLYLLDPRGLILTD
jgi:replicative DNA helicase